MLHSKELPITNSFVPTVTVHDSTETGAKGATVLPRSQHENAEPPVPKEFWADDKLQELVQQNRKDFESIDGIE